MTVLALAALATLAALAALAALATLAALAALSSTTEIGSFLNFVVPPIDIESLQNRLLKVCHVPATSNRLPGLLFLLRLLTVLIKQTRQAVCAVKQSILLGCLWHCPRYQGKYIVCLSSVAVANIFTNKLRQCTIAF
jgi:hypothetical protein